MPAAYLTPQLIGTIVGRSILAKDIDTTAVREYLRKEFEIRSNKIGTLWTGVSLNRWMELFRLSHHHHDATNLDWMPLSVWSVALWEASHQVPVGTHSASPQESWLDYLLECDVHVQQLCQESIFRKDNDLAQGLKRRDPSALKEWKEQAFCANKDLSGEHFEESMDQLLEMWKGNNDGTTSGDGLSEEDWAKASLALEVVCASIALGQIPPDSDTSSLSHGKKDRTKLTDKPVVPNGYFSVDEGDLKADCVEVTIREIIDLLLWNEDIGAMDLLRLPSTASADLKAFYERLNLLQNQPDSAFDVGKEWFEILSGLPGCDYLAVGKAREIPYELAPTMDNVARVCHYLLMQGSFSVTDSTMDLGTSSQASEWKSLEDVANGWKSGPSLYVQCDALIHQDASNPGDTKKYEIATLQVEGNPNCIEIRMRCDWAEKSGFSAVTHLKEGRSIIRDDKWKETMQHSRDGNVTEPSFDQLGKLLALSQISDLGLLPPLAVESGGSDDVELLQLVMLATRFGCDRRGMVSHSSNSDLQQQRQQGFDRHETERNHDLLRNVLHQICDLLRHDRELCTMLLVCFLQESGDVVESSGDTIGTIDLDESLEMAIASLPQEILSSSLVQQALWNCRSGIIRGKVLAACAELRSGTVSWWDVLLSDFSPSEIFSLLSLLRASRN